MSYSQQETDEKLTSNSHYWLYKVTRDALDNENHPLHHMGHIWNRWVCDGLNIEETKKLGINNQFYLALELDERKEIENYINQEEKPEKWIFPHRYQEINFRKTKWCNDAVFNDFIFQSNIYFSGTTFKKCAFFQNAIFIKEVFFNTYIPYTHNMNYTHNTHIKKTLFKGGAYFNEAKFMQNADFSNIIFGQITDFKSAIFHGYCNFFITFFKDISNFSHTKFLQDTDFEEVYFQDISFFQETKFMKNTNFSRAKFLQSADFSDARFLGGIIKFIGCYFFKTIDQKTYFSFQNTIFASKINFSESDFQNLPYLTGTDFRAGINLDKVIFPKDIKGNLKTYQDAELTWHTFQTEMEKAGNHEKAIEYFGYELDARRYNKKTNRVFKIILWCYKLFSNYGQSISRPLLAWGACILISYIFHCYYLEYNPFQNLYQRPLEMSVQNKMAWRIAFKGSMPFITDKTGFYDRIFTDPLPLNQCFKTETGYNKSPFYHDNNLELFIFPAISGLHTFFSLIFIFLFGLGIRNRLRLK